MKVSILLPTRGRAKDSCMDVDGNIICPLIESFKSVIDTANSLENIEFLIRFDEDDTESINNFKKYISEFYPNADVKISVGKRWGYLQLHKYYNELSKMASGDLLWVWNDDLCMRTENWDLILQEASEDGNKFSLFNPYSNHMKTNYWYWGQSLFPIIPKKWFDTTGRWSSCHSVDTPVQMIAHSLGIFEYVDIYVEHLRYDFSEDPLFDDSTWNEKEVDWNDIFELILPLMISDVFLLNEKFNLIDKPMQGQFPNKVIPMFDMYDKLKSIN